MENTLFLSQLFGVLFAVVGLSLLFNQRAFDKVLKDFTESAGLYYMSGVAALLAGTAIVLVHNMWETPQEVLVSLLGWAAIFKGVIRVFLPEWGRKTMKKMVKSEATWYLLSLGVFTLGVAFLYFGFMA